LRLKLPDLLLELGRDSLPHPSRHSRKSTVAAARSPDTIPVKVSHGINFQNIVESEENVNLLT
jgi:hypothetical protein